MSFNTLIIQTISCLEDVLKFMHKVSVDKDEDSYLESVVSNLVEEWKQHAEGAKESKHKRQMSDHVVCSKKSYEDTLQRLRRSSNLEGRTARKSEDHSSTHLTIPSENAPILPPRNNITRGNVIRERKTPPHRHNLLKSSNSATELELERKVSDPPQRVSTPENSDTLVCSYDSLLKIRMKCLTPEVGFRAESPLELTKNSLDNSVELEHLTPPELSKAQSCSDLADKVAEESTGDSTLLSNSLRSSYVKFKPKNGRWSKMYLTLIGKNIYVSRNYADDQTELIYSLENFEIVPKDDGKSKLLILLKTNNVTQCSIWMKSSDIRDDWYKSMVRAKYRQRHKSSESLDTSPSEGERTNRSREAIYVSPNTVNPNAARNLGIKVVINDHSRATLERKKVSKEDENTVPVADKSKLDSSSGEYVVNEWDEFGGSDDEENYLSVISSPLNNGRTSCSLAFEQKTSFENSHFYLQH